MVMHCVGGLPAVRDGSLYMPSHRNIDCLICFDYFNKPSLSVLCWAPCVKNAWNFRTDIATFVRKFQAFFTRDLSPDGLIPHVKPSEIWNILPLPSPLKMKEISAQISRFVCGHFQLSTDYSITSRYVDDIWLGQQMESKTRKRNLLYLRVWGVKIYCTMWISYIHNNGVKCPQNKPVIFAGFWSKIYCTLWIPSIITMCWIQNNPVVFLVFLCKLYCTVWRPSI